MANQKKNTNLAAAPSAPWPGRRLDKHTALFGDSRVVNLTTDRYAPFYGPQPGKPDERS